MPAAGLQRSGPAAGAPEHRAYSRGPGRRPRPRLRHARRLARHAAHRLFRAVCHARFVDREAAVGLSSLCASEAADEPPRRSFRLPYGVENLRRRGAVIRIDVNHAGHRSPPHRLDLNRAICAPRASLRHQTQVRPCTATCGACEQAGSGPSLCPPGLAVSQQAQVTALAVLDQRRPAFERLRAHRHEPFNARTPRHLRPQRSKPHAAAGCDAHRGRAGHPRCGQQLAERRHRTARLKHHADRPLAHAARACPFHLAHQVWRHRWRHLNSMSGQKPHGVRDDGAGGGGRG